MPLITLPFESWRAVIDALRELGLLPYMREHADRPERMLDEHCPGDAEGLPSRSGDVDLGEQPHGWNGVPRCRPNDDAARARTWHGPGHSRKTRRMPAARPH